MIKKRYKPQTTNHEPRTKPGSALILTVVLTSLLAIIGVMFIMIARVDKMATSAISENKELNSAVETVVAKISQELVLDVPGMPKGRDYYDYPDANNAWLASLEPYDDAGTYKWQQISDVYEKLGSDLKLTAKIIPDYQNPSDVGNSNSINAYPADADGDGVADSKWVELDGITSGKGKPIYAAIRIVDNGGMLNVNTAYKFDPADKDANLIDGSSQMQINLFALAQRGASNTIGQLDDERYGSEPHNLNDYIKDVVWRYDEPNRGYTPFDISDELELRNRFIVKQVDTQTRIKNLWTDVFKGVGEYTPFDSSNFSEWPANVTYIDVNSYDYRHIGTTYNMDRIIDPNGKKMININRADANSICRAIRSGLDPNLAGADGIAAQIAVNLVDFRDTDSNVTTLKVNGTTYYGFERPCIYISEIAQSFKIVVASGPITSTFRRSYAIELYKPYYPEDDYPEPNQWRLNIVSTPSCPGNPFAIYWSGTKHFHVVCLNDPCVPFFPPVDFGSGDDDPKLSKTAQVINSLQYNTRVSSVSLQRKFGPGPGDWVIVDSITMPPGWVQATPNGETHSLKRDITLHKCIRRLWDILGSSTTFPSPGQRDPSYISPDPNIIQAHPANAPFTNIGEIGMLFRKSAYSQGPISIGPSDTEATARLNLADPCYQKLFQYLTVFDPAVYSWNDPNETRIKGRININTAPWYVIAQLPWVSQRKGGYNNTALAQAIVAYRDKLKTPVDYSGPTGRKTVTGINNIREASGFESIGELATVINKSAGKENYSMSYYTLGLEKAVDLPGFPDLTGGDGAPDDFEERDVIFARISNLVTVRSDVFTAYILVRIGHDGPQKRVIAILDRSNVHSGDGKVKIVAIHPVPDPR